MNDIPAHIVNKCVSGMSASIDLIRSAFGSIEATLRDNPDMEFVIALVNRQLETLTELTEEMQRELAPVAIVPAA